MAHVSVNSISRQQMANASCPAFRGGFRRGQRHEAASSGGCVGIEETAVLDVLQHPPIRSLIDGMHSSLIGGDLSVDPVLPAGVAI